MVNGVSRRHTIQLCCNQPALELCQIANVKQTADPEALERPRTLHNLHELAWKTVPASEPTTLAYFMRDYVGHLKHHLRQALPDDDL